jgi:hypothetical protein
MTESDEPVKPEAPSDASGGVQTGEPVQEDEATTATGEKEEAADEEKEGEGGLKNLLFKRKGEIKAPPENPAYDKSIDELEDAAEPQPKADEPSAGD